MSHVCHALMHVRQAVTVALEWRNLTYTVRVGRGKKATSKTILDRLSGVAPPSHLLAIMGPTGEIGHQSQPGQQVRLGTSSLSMER